MECWRAHFAAQESGDRIEAQDYVQALRDQKACGRGAGTVFDIACVPTLGSVEQTLVQLPLGKASGYDGITGELLRVHVPSSARLLVPIFTKAALGLYEPLEFRGGALVPLAKRAATLLSCDRFRSVLVSSLPGKIYHRQLRTLLLPSLQSVRGDAQAGAVPGISTEAIAMVARTFRSVAAARGQAWALTFFDVRAAYYRVLRQVLLDVRDTEAALRKLLYDLGVPGEALSELFQRLSSIGALSSTGAPEHLQRILSDALQGTWFRMDFGYALTLTHRGVRPGDSLADVLFAFTFSAYLASAERALEKAGVSTEMPQCSQQPLWPEHEVPESLACGSWADDFVQMTQQACNCTLSGRVVKIVTVFVEQAESVGIQLTFAVDKTASMLSHVGGQNPPVQSDDDGNFLMIHSSVSGRSFRLPVIEAYRHLGGIATVSGTPVPEIGYRHSLAMMSVRPLKAKLSSAYGIPQRIRSNLLRSLAISRYSFGSAALPLQAASHKRLWCKHYVAMWRCLWRRGKNEPYRHSYSVLGLAGAPPPPLALAMARAVLLRQITMTGPATLLQLLTVHWYVHPKSSWLGLLHDDVVHLAQYVPAARTLQAMSDPVAHLIEAVRDDPRWWVRQVKAACRQAQKDLGGMVRWSRA